MQLPHRQEASRLAISTENPSSQNEASANEIVWHTRCWNVVCADENWRTNVRDREKRQTPVGVPESNGGVHQSRVGVPRRKDNDLSGFWKFRGVGLRVIAHPLTR